MAVIKAGRTRLMKAGVTGAIIALIPAFVLCGLLVFFIAKKDAKLETVSAELNRYKEGTVCVLTEALKSGQEIKSENIKMLKGVFYDEISDYKMQDFIGKIMKTDAGAGTLLDECIVSDKEEYDENTRLYYIDYIDIPGQISDGVRFDIRICFPNGEDYLVAGNKKIMFRDEEGFYVDLNRREAMLLSSAQVDVSIYTGTKLYAAFYGTGFEKTEIQTYPVNSYVFELGQWEPNIVEMFSEDMFSQRQALENNLLEFMGVTNNLQ